MIMHHTQSSSPTAHPLRPAARRDRAQLAALQSARRNYERYLALARREAVIGDRIKAESYYQHAEHHLRVQATMEPPGHS
jgi:hypothetical protein